MSRKLKKKLSLQPDPAYQSAKVSKFVNCIMQEWKKETARAIVYGAFDEIKK